MKKNKFILSIVVILIVALILGYFYQQSLKTKLSSPLYPINNVSVSQSIDTIPPISKQSTVISGTTALDLLKQTAKIETKGEGVNAYVIKINERTASNAEKEYWAFYVNGKPAAVGAGSYNLMPNDKILWKIEKFQ